MAVRPLKGPFTVEAFQRLAETGILHEDDRVELIDGQVVEMSPIGPPHASCVRCLNRLLSAQLLDVAIVDVQNPVVLGDRDAPQADVAVLRPRPDAYRRRHPGPDDVLLVIEVADTTLAYDRDIKVPLYARTRIPETWLVDLAGDRIYVYREPAAREYASVRLVSRGDSMVPLCFPSATFSVDAILG